MNNKIKFALGALMVATASGAFAANTANTTRDQRMDDALQNYRAKNGGTAPASSSTGSSQSAAADGPKVGRPFGENMKAAGHQVAQGGREVGHAVAQGARKTGSVIKKGANKAVSMTKDKPAP